MRNPSISLSLILYLSFSSNSRPASARINSLDPFLEPRSLDIQGLEKLPWRYDNYNLDRQTVGICAPVRISLDPATSLEGIRKGILADPNIATCRWVLRYKVEGVHISKCPDEKRMIIRPDLSNRGIAAMLVEAADSNCKFETTLVKPGKIVSASVLEQGDDDSSKKELSSEDEDECSYAPDVDTSKMGIQRVWITKEYPVLQLIQTARTCPSPFTLQVTEVLKMPEAAHYSLPPLNTWSNHYVNTSNCRALTLEGEDLVKNKNPFELTLASSTFYLISQDILNHEFKKSSMVALLKTFRNTVQKSMAQARTVKDLMEFVKRLTTSCSTTILRQFVMPDACNGTNAIGFQINPGQLIPEATEFSFMLIPEIRLKTQLPSKEAKACSKMSIDVSPTISDLNRLCINHKKYSINELRQVSYATKLTLASQHVIKLPIAYKLEKDDAHFLLRFYDDEGNECRSDFPNPPKRWLSVVFTETVDWAPTFKRGSSFSIHSGIPLSLTIGGFLSFFF